MFTIFFFFFFFFFFRRESSAVQYRASALEGDNPERVAGFYLETLGWGGNRMYTPTYSDHTLFLLSLCLAQLA